MFGSAYSCGNVLFASAAEHHGRRTLGVALTGRADDGAEGARAIKRRGGRVLVHNPEYAASGIMPSATIATGCLDLVLPVEGIEPALVALVMARGGADLLRVATPPWAMLGSGNTSAAAGAAGRPPQ